MGVESPHLDQDGEKEARAELLHTFGRHAAVVAVVCLFLQAIGLYAGHLPVAWEGGVWCVALAGEGVQA